MTVHHRRSYRTAISSLVAALALALGLVALTACGSDDNASAATASQTADHSGADPAAASKESALYSAMRTQWGQHMEWTWSTVVAFAEDSPALPATLDRLLQVAVDQGNAIGAYYGPEAGEQATALLTEHFKLAVPVLTAAKAGDQKALKPALDAWYANAQEIADFLASANPNWEQKDLRDMMKMHITQTTAYASAILGGKYADAIVTYDEAEAHMMMLSDVLSQGIIAQFPDRF